MSIHKVDEAEVDEMWSYVGDKKAQRWLWQAIDHRTGTVLAYVFGRRKDEVFLQLKALLEPFGISRYYTDHLGTYKRHLAPEESALEMLNTRYALGEIGKTEYEEKKAAIAHSDGGDAPGRHHSPARIDASADDY